MKKIILILFICLVLVLGLIFYLRVGETNIFRVVFFNIGQGDSALIKFGDGSKMLVDCGPDRKILSKLGKFLPFYDRTIDYLLITHPDIDHYGGCVDVARRYKIGMVIENGATKDSDPYWRVWNQLKRDQGLVSRVVSGREIWDIASTTLEFFSPDSSLNLSDKLREGNNLSVVFRLVNASTTVLFAGDAEVALEESIIFRNCPSSTPCVVLKSDYLKIGHHGSDSSSSDGWLAAIDPKVAIISVGKNTFGHPSLRVLRHLQRSRALVWRTDEKDDIIIP